MTGRVSAGTTASHTSLFSHGYQQLWTRVVPQERWADGGTLKLPLTQYPGYDGTMNLGFPEMMFIFILALILFGPKKLPEIGRQVGRGLAEFKRASREFQMQIEDEVRKLEYEVDAKNTIAPTALTNTVPAESATLTASTAESASSEITINSTAEAARAGADTSSASSTTEMLPSQHRFDA